jgi:hypothetical protein
MEIEREKRKVQAMWKASKFLQCGSKKEERKNMKTKKATAHERHHGDGKRAHSPNRMNRGALT